MLSRSRYVLAGIAVIASIIALAALGVHGPGSASGAVQGNIRLAFTGATRTWVSGVGDDANPCSRTAPCKTFAGAISKTSAGGEIDSLDPGGFGALTITKAMTIDGLGGDKSSVLVAGTNGIVVAAGANDVVTLRHLQIQGVGNQSGSGTNGIRFISGKALILDDVVVEGFTQNGVDVALGATGSKVIIKNSSIYNNGGAAVSLTTTAGSVKASISGSELANNNDGLLAGSGADVDLGTSVVASNTAVGAGCQTTSSLACAVHTTHDQIDHNGSAIYAVHNSGSTARITISLSDDDVIRNGIAVNAPSASTTTVYTFVNNHFVSNASNGQPMVALNNV